jgi:phytanoyl-CoA hydroxylase
MTLRQKRHFERYGYVVRRGLFSREEVRVLRQHYMSLRASGPLPGDMVAETAVSQDPLQKFPRMIHMHRFDAVTRRWLLDPRLLDTLTILMGEEPLAGQSMLYFKPPGARGQALHQDNFYLRTAPGTCYAAWLALDPCDAANGCMQVVPASAHWPVLCHVQADTAQSFTNITAPLPKDASVEAVSVRMKPGDVLFFHGGLVHGSAPNISPRRFRRSLIGHFVPASSERLTEYDQPLLSRDGTEHTIEASGTGGPCGIWTEDTAGEAMIDPTGGRIGFDVHE